jgi:hypothetical protein
MKNTLLIVFACLFMQSLNAQVGFFSVGYSANWTKMEGLNQVVDDYNSTRDFLDVEMNKFRNLDGLSIGMAGGSNGYMASMDFNWARLKRSAEGVDATGLLQQRDLRVSNHSYSITSYFGGFSDQGGVGVGLRASFGAMKIKTRVYPKSESATEWALASKEISLNAGPALRFYVGDTAYLVMDVYYTFGLMRTPTSELSDRLNNYYPEDEDEYKNSMGIFGFTVSLAVGGDI